MTDVVDKATRSRMMAGIWPQNTRPELFLRKGLHSLGFRYRLHAKDIPGKPDLVFPKHRALIEVFGCFWHGHGCRYFKRPATNADFWKDKIERNQDRDRRNLDLVIAAGWRCLIVWECAIRLSQRTGDVLDVVELAARWLTSGRPLAVIDESGLYDPGWRKTHVFQS